MVHPNDIPEMEAALAERGFSVAELCRRASIAETTWGRWKRGEFMPSFRAWGSVTKAYSALLAGPSEAAAEQDRGAA
tara:strand:- start:294 stop:524 length:231 start_codon:yes stop_codon:yes gene_type:complete